MSTLPTRLDMSWLFSSPGSVLEMQTCFSREGCMRTTVNLVMSPPNSSSRLTAQGEIVPVRRRVGTP